MVANVLKQKPTSNRLESDLPDSNKLSDWHFARRPFWLFSHLFAASVVLLFIFLGAWQLDRLQDRRATNEVIAARALGEPEQFTSEPVDVEALDYQRVVVDATFVDPDFVRIANRSQGGVAGQWVVGIVRLDDGSELAVNRGFIPSNTDSGLTPVPEGSTALTGWLRQSVERQWPGIVDNGEGTVLPRLDTERVAARLNRDLPDLWLQVEPAGAGLATFPDPVPLPPLGEGAHRSYAIQWLIFAVLGVAFYVALLRRRSKAIVDEVEDAPTS